MRKKTVWLVVNCLMMLLLLSGCGVPQEEHDAILAERDAVLAERDAAEAELASLKIDLADKLAQIAALQTDYEKVASDLAATQRQISSLEDQTSSLERQISSLEKQISSMIRYKEGFSVPGSGWLRESEERYECDYEDGEYYIKVKTVYYEWYSRWSYTRNAGVIADYLLEIDARLVNGQSDYGIVFHLQDNDNFYYFLVSVDGYYYVGKKLNGIRSYLQSPMDSQFIEESNNINHLTVGCKASQIVVYINGHHVTTITDNSFTKGYFGMIVQAYESNSCVAFDNIRICNLD